MQPNLPRRENARWSAKIASGVFDIEANGPDLSFRVSAPNRETKVLSVREVDSATRHAFLAGKVGLQAHLADASFDNFCVARTGSSCADADSFLPPALIKAL